jgi:very-short-patch-repair endonuclease
MKRFDHNHYNPRLKEYARELRTETVSKAEKYIWKGLLSRKQTGERFLRQRPIDHFIVDFFAPEIGLIIEIDGNSHWHNGDYDRYREDQLVSLGYTLIRFTEGDVLNNLDVISEQVRHVIHVLRSDMPRHLPSLH